MCEGDEAVVSHVIRTTLRYVLMEGCRRIKKLQAELIRNPLRYLLMAVAV